MNDEYLDLNKNFKKNKKSILKKHNQFNLPFSAPYEVEDPYPSLSDYHDYEPQVILVVSMTTELEMTMTMKNVTLKMIKFNFS